MTYLENILSLESKTNITPKQTLILYIDKGINPHVKANNLITSLESKDIQVVIHEETKLGETVMYTGQLDNNAVVDGVYYEELDTNLPDARHVKLITASSKNEIPSHVEHIYLDETDEGLDEVFNTVSFESKSNIKLHRTPESILKEYGVEGKGRTIAVYADKDDLMEDMGVLSMEMVGTALILGIVALGVYSKVESWLGKDKDKKYESVEAKIKKELAFLKEIEGMDLVDKKSLVGTSYSGMCIAAKPPTDTLAQLKLIDKTLDQNKTIVDKSNTLVKSNVKMLRSILTDVSGKISTVDKDDRIELIEKLSEKNIRTMQANWVKVIDLFSKITPFSDEDEKYKVVASSYVTMPHLSTVESVTRTKVKPEFSSLSSKEEMEYALKLYEKIVQHYGEAHLEEGFTEVIGDYPKLADMDDSALFEELREVTADEHYGYGSIESILGNISSLNALRKSLFNLIKDSIKGSDKISMESSSTPDYSKLLALLK